MNELLRLAENKSTKFPELKEKIDMLLKSCYDDIDNGMAEIYEIELCYDLIKKLVVEDVILSTDTKRKRNKKIA